MKEHEKREDRVPTAPTLQGMEFSFLFPPPSLLFRPSLLPPPGTPLLIGEPNHPDPEMSEIKLPDNPKPNVYTLASVITPSLKT